MNIAAQASQCPPTPIILYYPEEGIITRFRHLKISVAKKLSGGLTTATPSSQTSGYTVNPTTGPSIAGKTASTVSLKWNKTEIANNVSNKIVSGYYIYRSTKKTSGFKKAYSGSKLIYTKKSLKKGKKYFIKVRAYTSVGSKKHYGAYSSVKSIKF